MPIRPLSRDEREYLTLLKGGLDAAFQGALISAGLVALPLGFLFSALGSRQGLGDRIALALAVAILAGFTWAILAYSGKGGRSRVLRKGDVQLRQRLGEDLDVGDADVITGVVEAKEDERTPAFLRRKPDPEAPRRFFLRVAGRRLEVSGQRWLATAIGEETTIELATRSGVVLAIDGVRDRLPLGDAPRGADEDALGLPTRPG